MSHVAKKSTRNMVSDILVESARDSTTHGIPHMFKREYACLKFFWLVCFVVSACVCAYVISKSVLNYFEYETVSKVETIFEVPTLFPTVSICNLNAFTTEEAFRFNEAYFDQGNLSNKVFDAYLESSFTLPYAMLRYAVGANLHKSNITDEIRQRMGLSLKDMIVDCTYNQKGCSPDDFEWYFDTLYGSCYSFNSGKNSQGQKTSDKYCTKPGAINGLNIELYVGEPTNKYSLSFLKGIHVQVHNRSRRPVFFDGIEASPGYFTKVALNREFTSRLDNPYSECVREIDEAMANESIFLRTLLDHNMTYRQSDCFNVCFQKYVVKNCSCYIVDFPFWNNTKVDPCQSFRDIECFIRNYGAFFNYGNINELCSNQCPPECNSVSYMTSVSASQYPSYVYGSYLRKNSMVMDKFNNRSNMTLEELRANLLAINIFYSELSYRKFYEIKKMDVIDLVSNVGGTLGLFLGMSFLSFVEVIDVFLNVLFSLFSKMTSSKVSFY